MEYGGGLVADGGVFGTMVGGGDQADIIEELLGEGCWIEASENSLMSMQQTTAQSQYMSNNNNIPMGMGMGEGDHFNHHHHHHHHQMECTAPAANHDDQESGFVVGKRWWIGPRANPGPTTSVKERLVVAVGYLKEYTKNSSNNVLIQIWVPMRRRSALIHTHNHYLQQESSSAPVSVNPNMNVHVRFFRSHDYPRHQQQQQQQQYGSLLALPVFERGSGTCLGVIEFVISNQTLINYRPQLDHLSNALEAVDFRSSHNMNIPQAVKVFEELYEAAVNEIMEVLASVCKTHNLPLALTWAPCLQQQGGGMFRSGGKGSCGVPTDQMSMMSCISTVDSACYVGDMDVLGFQEACSEYHLFNGQGIVGTAFTTTKPCFAIDITAFSKSEYPLAHHANMFGLHAAVAIPLRSVYTGSAADFVLEFFLPKDCRDTEQQKQMLNSLSLVVQQACRSLHLHVVMDDNNMNDNNSADHDHDHDQFTFPTTTNSYMPSSASEPLSQVDAVSGCSTKDTSSSCSWIAHMMEAQNKGKGVSVSLEYLQEPKEEFKVTTCNWDREREDNVFSEFGQVLQQQHDQSSNSRASVVSVEAGEESPGACGRRSSSSSSGRKSGDKRRTKAEKTISLPVLRQYFAGSLKDAAKSIGVCPTTLKRICRQHGITRWPSRKIKKVGHSLKKLQLVIDSVQGAEGAIQIGSFYASFPELSTATANGGDGNDHNNNNNNSFYNNHGDGIVTSLKSPPSACSQTHAGNKLPMTTAINHHVVMTENPTGAPLGGDHALMHASNINIQDYHQLQEDLDTKQLLLHFNNNNNNQILPPRPTVAWNNNNSSSSTLLERGAFRVKATFADEKIRFSLQAMWGFRDLQLEIARRFNLTDMNNLVLKYLDDEGEWVVLSCDADLEECKDLHTSSHTRTIRLSLFQASPLNLPNTFRNSSSSPSS